jgi:hypothetical protein
MPFPNDSVHCFCVFLIRVHSRGFAVEEQNQLMLLICLTHEK